MTDNDYLSLIEQGVEAWNRWREENPEVKPDLSRAYLFEADLSGFNFSNVNFNRVCLIGANLKRANLSSADLNGAYANGANLSEANLNGANLNSANLSETNLNGANLAFAQVEATDLTAAQMTGACLENWRISRATKLHKIEGQYVYFSHHQKRCPVEGTFKPGELAALLWAEVNRLPVGTPVVPSVPTPQKQVAPQKQVTPAWMSPPGSEVESKSAPAKLPLEESAEVSVAQLAPSPKRSRSIPWEILVGVGVGLAVIAAIASFPRPRTVTELPPLVCNEPPLPPVPSDPPNHEYNDGTRFYGGFVGTAPADGRGSMIYPNGDRYDGEFRDGKRNGCGTFTFASGRSYVGQFRDDQFQGQGIWMLENGDRYIGEFQANKCNGQGTFISVDGSQKTGIWENGDLAGENLSCDRSPLELPGSPK